MSESLLLSDLTGKWVLVLQSAASQSQHVVNILTSGDPINAEDVSQLAKAEGANSGDGQVAKGGPAAKAQVRSPIAHACCPCALYNVRCNADDISVEGCVLKLLWLF